MAVPSMVCTCFFLNIRLSPWNCFGHKGMQSAKTRVACKPFVRFWSAPPFPETEAKLKTHHSSVRNLWIEKMNCLTHFESRSCRWQCPKVQPHDWSCRLAKQSRQQCGCQIYWRNACSKHHCKRPSVGWQYATAPLHQVRWRRYLHISLTDVCLYTSDIYIYILYIHVYLWCLLLAKITHLDLSWNDLGADGGLALLEGHSFYVTTKFQVSWPCNLSLWLC